MPAAMAIASGMREGARSSASCDWESTTTSCGTASSTTIPASGSIPMNTQRHPTVEVIHPATKGEISEGSTHPVEISAYLAAWRSSE